MKLYTTREVADRLGISMRRVQQCVWDSNRKRRLMGKQIGRDILLTASEVKRIAGRNTSRGPKKHQNGRR